MSAGDLPRGALGFGCAELFRLPSARARRRVLDAALDAGIAHFDVAPMYGLGAAEGELGASVRARGGSVSIATKFGIGVTPAARLVGRVQGPIRRVLEARPALRERARESAPGPDAGGAGSMLYTAPGYGADAARASLERSLRALGVDHVALLLLHDPPVDLFGGAPDGRDGASDRAASGLVAALEEARAAGLIGTWGVAGEPAPAVAVATALAAPVLQLRADVLEPTPEGGVWGSERHSGVQIPKRPGGGGAGEGLVVTFGTLGVALGRIAGHLDADPVARARWAAAVGLDVGDPEVVARLLLRHARRLDPDGITLFGTTKEHRVASAVAAAGSAELDESVDALVALVGAELGAATAVGGRR